jgi:hypothetical protein
VLGRLRPGLSVAAEVDTHALFAPTLGPTIGDFYLFAVS